MIDKNMPILIVDDWQTMLRIMRNLLKQIGFDNVDEAVDGCSALQMLREKDYSLVISNWSMLPMNGLELFKEMRTEANLKDVPFILITAEAGSEAMIAAKEAGVNGYLVKPFNAAMLKSKLVSVLGSF